MSPLLFCLFLLVCSVHAFGTRDLHEEIRHRMKEIAQTVQYCEMFPVLGPIPPKYPPLMELIDTFASNISKLVQTDGTPSITVNLIYDQDILWTQGYGLKNLSDPSSAPDGDTPYMIGSNTKLFTTLLALIAQDKGLLSFTDEVAAYEPAFDPINPYATKKSITFAQLASHMAGMPRVCPCTDECNLSNKEMWSIMQQNVTIINPPGFMPSYSNCGFSVLGHVVEEIMNKPYANLIQDEILQPLGMSNSGTNVSDSLFMDTRALGYTYNDTLVPPEILGWESPAGSMYSTTNDMANFVSFFFRDDVAYMAQPDQILDGLSIREWMQPRFINIDLTGYGLPWEILQSPIIYTKSGGVNGYLSLTITVPQLKFGMIILQSSDAVNTIGEVFDIWATSVVNPFAQILQAVSPVPYIPPNFIDNFIGRYVMGNSTIMISTLQAHYLNIILTYGQLSSPLQYFSGLTFKIDANRAELSCMTQQSGFEQYISFYLTSIPSFAIPGLFPGQTAVKIN